jgi:hypothetical protein
LYRIACSTFKIAGGNLTLVHRDDGTSCLVGPVADQAQLYGVLDALRDIGATLLLVRAEGCA